MRKSAIVLGFGAFFLTCGLLFKFYAYPRLAVVPLDQNTRQVVEGPDSTYLDVENLKITTGLLTTVATVIGDPDASKAASEETGRDPCRTGPRIRRAGGGPWGLALSAGPGAWR